MNINVMEALKTNNIDFSRKTKDKNDSGQSFVKTFNKMLEKNKSNLKGKEKTKETDRETSKKSKDDNRIDGSKEVVNRSPLIDFQADEKTINLQVPEENQDLIKLQALGGQGELTLETLTSMDSEKDKTNFNLNLEDVKNNLSKALGKETGDETLKANSGKVVAEEALSGDLSKVGIDQTLLRPLTKELEDGVNKDLSKMPVGQTGEKPDGKVSETINLGKIAETKEDGIETKANIDGDFKNLLSGKKENLYPALSDELESLGEDSKSLGLIKKLDGENASKEIKSEETLEVVDSSKSNVDTNFLLNRIQNSISGLEKMDEMLSLENLQNIEDTMIKFMKVSKEGDASLMKVKLYPEELGSIDISLKFQNGKLIADIMVESEKVRAMFLNNSDILNKNLLEQNIPLKNINVWVNDKFNSFGNFNGQGKEGQADQEKGQNLNRSLTKDLNNSPIDNMRIEKINNGVRSLNILV